MAQTPVPIPAIHIREGDTVRLPSGTEIQVQRADFIHERTMIELIADHPTHGHVYLLPGTHVKRLSCRDGDSCRRCP